MNLEEAMKKLTANDPETKSPDLADENLARLRALFPELVTEGPDGVAVNLDVLKQLVGDQTVTDAEEKYGLNWHGKRRARQLALTPSTGTLRPCPADSVDWDTTQHLMIEGDNLEVLKLLQKSYAGKVKLIYIDPPYNTGKDFIYKDDFKDNIKNYLMLTSQIDSDGRRISSNTEASGRFHTDWLNMMYPRLKLARNLLRQDGALIASIGDEEVSAMVAILKEIFGEENHSANFAIIRSEGGGLAKQVVRGHDYLLVYSKDLSCFQPLRRTRDIRGEIVEVNGEAFWIEEDWLRKEFGKYGTCPYNEIEKYHGADKKREIDEGLASGMYRLLTKRDNVRIVGRLRKVADDASKFYSVQKHLNAKSSNDLQSIGMPEVFDFPKPVSLISELVLGGSFFTKTREDIILDFFAGSGTTGHAVMVQNVADGGNRRYILVQLPEPLDQENKEQKAGADFCDKLGKPRTIAELTKERLRRAGRKIKDGKSDYKGDLGFRVFKLASSNIQAWEPDRENLAQTLEASVEHLKTDRTEQDVLFELLLKLGLDLCVPIERKQVAGGAKQTHEVHSIGGGSLLVCLSPAIPKADVEPLALGLVAWHKELKPAGETTVVFRDSAFADDVAKTNLAAILNQHGLETVRSL